MRFVSKPTTKIERKKKRGDKNEKKAKKSKTGKTHTHSKKKGKRDRDLLLCRFLAPLALSSCPPLLPAWPCSLTRRVPKKRHIFFRLAVSHIK